MEPHLDTQQAIYMTGLFLADEPWKVALFGVLAVLTSVEKWVHRRKARALEDARNR